MFNCFRAADTNYSQSATTANFTLTVGKGSQTAITITSATTGTFGTAYTATATGGTGTGALTWTLGAGSTATGAAINSAHGDVTFASPGTVVFNCFEWLMLITISPQRRQISRSRSGKQHRTQCRLRQQHPVRAAYTATATGGSGTGAYFSALGAGSSAPGAAINSSTGVVTFTGTGTVVLNCYRAADTNYSQSATTANFTVTITQPVPVITSPLTDTAINGVPYSYQITASNSPTSFGATGLPAGLSVNSTSGLISGTPTVQGSKQHHLDGDKHRRNWHRDFDAYRQSACSSDQQRVSRQRKNWLRIFISDHGDQQSHQLWSHRTSFRVDD